MLKKLLLVILLLNAGLIHARNDVPEWRCTGNVKKLFSTPLGTVYKLGINNQRYVNKPKAWINSIQWILWDKQNRRKALKSRFVVIDFIVRYFPALSNSNNAKFRLFITQSSTDNIRKFEDLNGFGTITGARLFPLKKIIFNRTAYTPDYEPVAVRLIWELNKSRGVVSVNINGTKKISLCNTPTLPKSFGLMVVENKISGKNPRNILEVSNPSIRFFENKSELSSLSSVKISFYPYDKYFSNNVFIDRSKKYTKIKNPDALYAMAKKMLTVGENLPLAIKILERAAKKEHIFAMYELSVCFHRGIGVQQNPKKAAKWLKKATRFNCPQAWAFLGQLHLNEYNSRAMKKVLSSFIGGNWVHDSWVFEHIMFFGNPVPKLKKFCSTKQKMWGAWCIDQAAKSSKYKPFPLIKSSPINDLLAQNYPPALLYQGRSLMTKFFKAGSERTKEALLAKAKNLFQRGMACRNNDCELEILRLKAIENTLSSEAFTTERNLRLALYPLYQVLKFFIKNPQYPNKQKFLYSNMQHVLKIKSAEKNPEANFLTAACNLQYYLNTNLYRMPSRLKNASRKNQDLIIRNLNESFSVLEYAGQKGCAPALLIAGGLYINGRRGKNFPVGGEPSNNELRKGISLLNQISPPSIESNFYLAKAKFMLRQSYSKDLIDKLLPACKADYAEAWLLLGDISSKKGNAKFETLAEYYEKAAKLGSFQAYDRLGWLYYRKGKIEKANQYWKKFVEHDSEERLNNIFDLYGGKISAPEFGIVFTSKDTKKIQNYYHNY